MFKSLKPKQVNAVAVVNQLLQSLQVKVSKTTISENLQDHPEFPSLLAISDCLTEWHLPNQAYQIAKEDYDPSDLEFPFIAHSKASGGLFMLVHEINNGNIIYSDDKNSRTSITEEEFLKRWSGVALHATTSEKSGESNYQGMVWKEIFNSLKLPVFLLLTVALILLSINYQTTTIGFALATALKLAGITVGVLLLMHSIDANNPLIQNLCSLGNKNNCNAILKSDAAKVTSWLSWSEVGFYYFTGSLLALLMVPTTLPLLVWLNVLALPYTVYSIGYQYKQKNWCVLCCTVQAILWLEFICNITLNNAAFSLSTLSLSLPTLALFAIAFLMPVVTWSLLKPFLLKTAQFKPLKQQLKKFKYNSELFNQVLTSQPRFAVPDDLMPVVLGNPNAETTITMVSNPFCGPCAKAHEILDQWISVRDDIKLKVIFTTADHDNDERTKVARHVAALSRLNDAKLLENALNDWYKQSTKKYETWAEKYPISFNGEMNSVTEKQKEWCAMAEIAVTPTILVNGYKLPEPYRLEDIKYLLA